MTTTPSASEDKATTRRAKPAQPAVPPRVQARPDHIRLIAEGRNTWHVIAPPEHTLDQVRDLRYLWHRHADFRPGDVIIIRHAYFQYELEIYVREVDTEAQAIVGYHSVRDFTTEELQVPDLTGAEVTYMGGPHGYAVHLGSQHLKSGFETEGEATAWLRKKQSRGA